MNLEKNEEHCTISMLVTKNGYLVKVHKTVEENQYRKICFFVDKDFNHRPWRKTIDDGMPLVDKEFYRLKNHSLNPLQEITLSEAQWVIALAIVELVEADPYYGVDEDRKKFYREENALSLYANYYATFKKSVPREKVALPPAPKDRPTLPAIPATKEQPKKTVTWRDSKEAIRKAKKESVTLLGIKGGFEILARLRSA